MKKFWKWYGYPISGILSFIGYFIMNNLNAMTATVIKGSQVYWLLQTLMCFTVAIMGAAAWWFIICTIIYLVAGYIDVNSYEPEKERKD